MGYVVWTPPGYSSSAKNRYPVIYFLHGMGGTESSDAKGFSEYVSTAVNNSLLPPVICVFPNGGVSGYRGDVEKMIIEELISTIDSNYCTLVQTQSRVLTGFSMGGSGSISLVAMHPDLFCVAGSMGGGLRTNECQLISAGWFHLNLHFFTLSANIGNERYKHETQYCNCDPLSGIRNFDFTFHSD